MTTILAPAKINLALVVGPRRPDGKHELVTVFERVALADEVCLEPGDGFEVVGFAEDTIVRRALDLLSERAGATPGWRVTIEKRIPVAAGLGGGSSDAAAALRLANASLSAPLADEELSELAATVGADVPFFLTRGPQLGRGDGTELEPLDLPRDYQVVLVLPEGTVKRSTADVYATFDDRGGEAGFADRSADVLAALAAVSESRDLAALPANDLAEAPLADRLVELGAFRADVTGAGPTVYGLFSDRVAARRAARELAAVGRTWATAPAWYG